MKGKKIAALAALGAGLYWILKRDRPAAAQEPDASFPENPYIKILNPELGRNVVGGTVTTVEWETNIPEKVDVYYRTAANIDPYWVWVATTDSGITELYIPVQVGALSIYIVNVHDGIHTSDGIDVNIV